MVKVKVDKIKPPSARMKAKLLGSTWFMPESPCKRCETTALKRVNNSECQGCNDKAASKKEKPIRRQEPYMVISRSDAISRGLNTYRTGELCGKGHAGWRWVSTRGCLTCQGRD